VSDGGRFLSTLSVRRATPRADDAGEMSCISIHALREESDPETEIPGVGFVISIHALREESDQ